MLLHRFLLLPATRFDGRQMIRPTFTMIVQVRRPKDQTLFEDRLWNVHFRLVKAIPGIKTIRVHRVVKARSKESDLYGLIELCFDNRQALETAMDSEEATMALRDGSKLESEAGTAMTFDYYCETNDA